MMIDPFDITLKQFLNNFHFLRPEYLWLLGIVILLMIINLLIKLMGTHSNNNAWKKICNNEILQTLYLKNKDHNPNNKNYFSLYFIFICLVLALSGPTWIKQQTPVYQNKNSWIIALSLADSMLATDMSPSRLQRAKYKIKDFLNYLTDEQLGLIVFTNLAYDLIPITNDKKTIEHIVLSLDPLIMPVDGSNISSALTKAHKLTKNLNLKNINILLLTDDNANAQSLSMAKTLANNNISINIINFNKSKDNGFNNSLVELSNLSNGLYHEFSSDDQDLITIKDHADSKFKEIYQKDKSSQLTQVWQDMGPWLLLILLPFILLHFFLSKNYRYYTLLLSIGVFLAWSPNNVLYASSQAELKSSQPSLWQRFWRNNQQIAGEKLKQQINDYTNPEVFSNPKWQAAAEYHNKNYKKSEEILQNLDLDSNFHTRYNYANSLAMQGKINEAVESYNKILANDTTNQDALFNKQLLEKYLKSREQNKNQEQNKDKTSDAKKDPGQDKNQEQNNNQNNKAQKQDKQKSGTNDDKQTNDNKSANGDSTQESKKQQASKQQESKQKEPDTNNLIPEAQYQQNQTKKNDKNADDQQQQTETSNAVAKNDPELEKWLNKIPDNPAIYLKNQLQYEYLLEQQANKN